MLCRTIKQDERLSHIPVVLLTAKASEEAEVEGLEAGADDYITKPFHAAALLARVENLIEIRRLLRQRFSGEVMVQPSEVSVPPEEAVFLGRVRDIVEAHLGDSRLTVEWLAEEVGLSPRQLRRRPPCTRKALAGRVHPDDAIRTRSTVVSAASRHRVGGGLRGRISRCKLLLTAVSSGFRGASLQILDKSDINDRNTGHDRCLYKQRPICRL